MMVPTAATAFLTHYFGAIRASRRIHELLLNSVLSTTFQFLDKTPAGRIVARFNQDIRAVDGNLAENLEDLCFLTASLSMKLAAVVYLTPAFLLPSVAFAGVGYVLGKVYIAAQLSVKRFVSSRLIDLARPQSVISEMSNARSPVLSHFGATINGVTSIRAYGAEDAFKIESLKRIDKYTRPSRVFYNLDR
jgi:ABC-type multidrug transport system fused ATPase/permease subunit